MTDKRIYNPHRSYSADISKVSRSHETATIPIYAKKKTQLLGPVTVLVDSQVSDCCPWATCCFTVRFERFSLSVNTRMKNTF